MFSFFFFLVFQQLNLPSPLQGKELHFKLAPFSGTVGISSYFWVSSCGYLARLPSSSVSPPQLHPGSSGLISHHIWCGLSAQSFSMNVSVQRGLHSCMARGVLYPTRRLATMARELLETGIDQGAMWLCSHTAQFCSLCSPEYSLLPGASCPSQVAVWKYEAQKGK